MLRELAMTNPYHKNSKDKITKSKQKLIKQQESNKSSSHIEIPNELVNLNQNILYPKNNQEYAKPLLNVNDLSNDINFQKPIFNNYPDFNCIQKSITNNKKQRAKSANKLNINNYPNYYNLIKNQNNNIEGNTSEFGNIKGYLNSAKNYSMKVNDNINNLENMISAINDNGFNKYQKEIDNKKLILSQLENSIDILKNKISKYKNLKKDNLSHEAKKKIKYEKLRNVSKRYESIGKSVVNYKNEVPKIEEEICKTKNETTQINSLISLEQNEINLMQDNIRKLNKVISNIKKENENLLPAITLLKKHINATKNKINNIDKGQNNFMNKINGFSKKL